MTKREINKELPNLHALRSKYRLPHSTGVINTKVRTFWRAYFVALNNDYGYIATYGYGEICTMSIPKNDGCGKSIFGDVYDITDLLYRWMKGTIDRKFVVNCIYEKVNREI